MVTDSPDITPELYDTLHAVTDPEIPVISILDLGVVRRAYEQDGIVHVYITPTYSGCPATDVMGDDIIKAFANQGKTAQVHVVLNEAWTTDWITEKGREAMREYGIAPPLNATADKDALLGNARVVPCTNCKSTDTKLVSQFGSTACKALFQCNTCQEPFDYFKCLR